MAANRIGSATSQCRAGRCIVARGLAVNGEGAYLRVGLGLDCNVVVVGPLGDKGVGGMAVGASAFETAAANESGMDQGTQHKAFSLLLGRRCCSGDETVRVNRLAGIVVSEVLRQFAFHSISGMPEHSPIPWPICEPLVDFPYTKVVISKHHYVGRFEQEVNDRSMGTIHGRSSPLSAVASGDGRREQAAIGKAKNCVDVAGNCVRRHAKERWLSDGGVEVLANGKAVVSITLHNVFDVARNGRWRQGEESR